MTPLQQGPVPCGWLQSIPAYEGETRAFSFNPFLLMKRLVLLPGEPTDRYTERRSERKHWKDINELYPARKRCQPPLPYGEVQQAPPKCKVAPTLNMYTVYQRVPGGGCRLFKFSEIF